MRVDGAPTDAIQSFEFPRSPKVVPLNVQVHRSKWQDQHYERGCGNADERQGEQRTCAVYEELGDKISISFDAMQTTCTTYHVERSRQNLVDSVNVTISLVLVLQVM